MGCPFHNDPFARARREEGVVKTEFQEKEIPMLLRYKEVRRAAKDWKTFSSDAPFRVVIPSEEDVRSVRQLPIETDPPDHTEYRKLVEPYFRRPRQPEVIEAMEGLVDRMLEEAMTADSLEAVKGFALPLQSHTLALMLKMPPSEAETWIGWGTHVFYKEDGSRTGSALDDYIARQLDLAEKDPGDNFFGFLSEAEFRDRPLTRAEKEGFANLTFAGGRDTVINSITFILHFFAEQPEQLEWLRANPGAVTTATEEFVRAASPLAHIGRVCPAETKVGEHTVPANERISLNWASANRDETVFEKPEEVRLDRKPNPHVAFGSGAHSCLGAHQARLVLRSLLKSLVANVDRIDLLDKKENRESIAHFSRTAGFQRLELRLHAK